ncbi:pyroglutamyl-peptidase [Cryobacterium mesophilum]|uniref:Pyroglutamyl-peptidase I n=1 Tax=Terrimesophilobacter mesophilus TaxID=433647 RepID=A0A4R8V6I7_9MICO|nr:pyroglutamyl-peptidase I [Terrimesophilobacter mesophilus]MBB5634098.1 pyroglutamyl-peptidase [Terrimesophilobacter mesophilus]TFB78684.1 pyroglutamyl-peptidase I [Terrimesophilobacter mesophilus]
MTTVLLTGFDPFGGDDHNSSWDAVQLVAREWATEDILVTACLPVEFGRAIEELIALIDQHSPDLVIATGVAGGRTLVTPERVAINLRDARIPDNAGRQPIDEPVVAGGPDAHFTRLPVAEMVARMNGAGVPATVSLSAGAYVCNDLMYGLLHALAGTGLPAGFIHVPDRADLPTVTVSAGLRIAIEVGLEADTTRKVGRVRHSGSH